MGTFNVKVISYPNGEIQIRRYSSPITTKEPNYYEDEKSNGIWELNPFDYKKTREVDEFTEPNHATQEENETRSYNRTKQKIHEYSRCIAWEKFITLTFNPQKIDRYNFTECSRVVRQWLHNQRRNAPNLAYLIVPELHKDGAWHFHGLLANTGKMKFADSGKRTADNKIIYNMSAWSYGFTTATDVSNTHSIARYVGKYITKDLCNLTKGKQRYFISTNLDHPQVSNFLVSDDDDFNDLLETLANSYGVDVVHISKPRKIGAYVDVDYYELQERINEHDNTTSI